MNRNTILGFAGGLVFAASLVIGLIVADAATDQGGGEPRLPGALGEPIEIVTGGPISDPDASVDSFDQPIEPTNAAYVPVDAGSSGGGPAGGGGDTGIGADGTVPSDTTELTVAPLAPDPFAPVEIDPRFEGMFTGDDFLGLLEFPPFRFLDLCADDAGLPGCPFGVGGTVLAPLDGHPDTLGDFRLGSALRPASGPGSVCDTPEEGGRPFFVWANHPATFEIRYYPSGQPAAWNEVIVSNTDPDNPEFERFTSDAVEGRLATSPWPRECFTLLAGGDRATHFTVEVNATSFFGGTASEIYTVDITEGSRPPVLLVPFRDRDDISVQALIPVKRFIQGPSISFVNQSEATTCADAEADGHFGEILPDAAGGHIFYGLTEPHPEPGPWWEYDPAYDATTTINVLGLQQGTTYLVCIWWFESASRSFDDSAIVDREMRWVTTPSTDTAIIWAHSVENTSSGTIEADSYTVGFSCGSSLPPITIPSGDMALGAELPTDGAALCDYAGRPIQIPTVGFFVTPRGFRHDFAIALDTSSPGSVQRFPVDLSTVGLSFDEPGPTLTLHAMVIEGSDLGSDRWRLGVGEVFEPPPAVPEELPDEIQIDIFASGVESAGQHGIRVTAAFDRPVQLRAFLERDIRRESEPCLTGPRPSFDSDVFYPGGFEQVHSFTLDGLCLRTRYWVWLQVWDEAGNSAIFADTAIHLVLPPGTRYFNGIGMTDGRHVEYTVRPNQQPIYDSDSVIQFDVSIDGVAFDLRRPSGCFELEVPVIPGADVWANEVTVTVRFTAVNRAAGEEGCGPSEAPRWQKHASISATFTIEEFTAGEVTISFSAADVLGDRGFPVNGEVLISGEVTR